MKIIALMGKAGSGKDTLLQSIMARYPNLFHEIVSCTTRPPREGEQDGINYHFLTIEEFMNQVDSGEMLEASMFNGWYYGTALSNLSEDKVNIGVFNPHGVTDLTYAPNIELDTYYVRVPDKERLLRQLNREENPDVQEIVRRFSADEYDFEDLSHLTYTEVYNIAPEDIPSIVEEIVGRNS